MKKFLPFINTILIIVLMLIIVFKKEKEPKVIIPQVEYIEAQNTHTKEIVNNLKEEVRVIEDSENYKKLRNTLDSLILHKDTTPVIINTCLDVVEKQDTVISKQKEIIINQDFIIKNDSVIKVQYKEEITQLEKKTKTNLWKGRAQGGVVGFISGYILSKKY